MSTVVVSSQPGRRSTDIRRAAANVFLGVLPAALTAGLAFAAIHFHWVAYDFSRVYYPAVTRLLHGGSPYASTHSEIVAGSAFVYPALAATVLAPFGLVHRELGDHLYMVICLLSAIGTLWIMRVRDWRIYGAMLMWFPVVTGWQDENLSLPIAALVALFWRCRERPIMAGLLAAVAISLKPFAWPLVLWLLVTRRWRAAAWAIAWGVALNLITWGIVGFNEIHACLRISGQVTDAFWAAGYGVLAAAHQLGFSRGVGDGLVLVLSLALALAIAYVGFVKRRDRDAIVLTIVLMLVASPLVWAHYFVLLMIPLALVQPRFHPIWLVPVAMWLIPPSVGVSAWQFVLAWVLASLCFAHALRAPREARAPTTASTAVAS